jgi:hypothetical protein
MVYFYMGRLRLVGLVLDVCLLYRLSTACSDGDRGIETSDTQAPTWRDFLTSSLT